jgi:hypothetical protein
MSEIDEYIDARGAAEKLCARLTELQASISIVTQGLYHEPSSALQLIPESWPTRENLSEILLQTEKAFSNMQSRWKDIPPDKRKHVSAPFTQIADANKKGSPAKGWIWSHSETP